MAAETRLPNIIFVLIDDMGWADVGCYGSAFHKTPHLDKLARQGMKFTDAYAAGPVCSPTRASILTGKHPARLHLTDWLPGRKDMPSQKMLRPRIQMQLPLEEVTLAEALKPAGYVSASIGKWHLGGSGYGPEAQGFDLNVAGDHTGTPLSYFFPYRKQDQTMPGLEKGEPGEYLTDRLTAEAEQFIERNKDKPFFLYLPHYAVHTPLKAKQDLIAKYEAQAKPGSLQSNAIYAAMVESVDDSVGRLMRKLDELKLAEQTVFIFTSDNGGLSVKEGPNTPATSNAPLRAGKGHLYEGGIREPLIVRWPGVIPPGAVCPTPVSSVDFFPTLLDIAGIKPDAASRTDGVSLVPLLKQSGNITRGELFWHYPHYSNQGGKPGGAVRQGDLKLIEFYETGRVELYNLKEDLGETKNLANQMPQKVTELRGKLDEWRRSVNAQMPAPNPNYRAVDVAMESHVIQQSADGLVLLPAKDVTIHGTMVRYEPQPHKNTIGYWTRREDWVSWEFYAVRPGTFEVEILQGCGNRSGGSEIEFSVGRQTLTTTVIETGGFQTFVPRQIGQLKLEQPGRYTLSVKPLSKPGAAVMDLRSVTLRPVKP